MHALGVVGHEAGVLFGVESFDAEEDGVELGLVGWCIPVDACFGDDIADRYSRDDAVDGDDFSLEFADRCESFDVSETVWLVDGEVDFDG